jgi:acyl transferase domain-containing protein
MPLKADQRAMLQLLLERGQSYDDIASVLGVSSDEVRERARAALDALGPDEVHDLPLEDQDDVADYLLGQQSASRRAQTRELLERSSPARAWARTVASELRPLAGDTLPEIPAEQAETFEAFEALDAREQHRERVEQSSKVGGAILLGAIALLIAGVLALVLGLGGGGFGGHLLPPLPPPRRKSL